MLTESTTPCRGICKCCGSAADLYDVCDFSKNCEEGRGKHLPLTGIPVYYYKCLECGFIFTTKYDNLTPAELQQYIYNDEYLRLDPDYSVIRPRNSAIVIAKLFSRFKTSIRIVDYGGGNGVFATTLKHCGFTDVETFDPFNDEFVKIPSGTFNLITSFEVVEHVPDPYDTFKRMVSLLDVDNGLIVFSTLLQPDDIDTIRTRWWYIAPRNGHISIYTFKSLSVLSIKLGLTVMSANSNLHCAFKRIPDFALHMFKQVQS